MDLSFLVVPIGRAGFSWRTHQAPATRQHISALPTSNDPLELSILLHSEHWYGFKPKCV